MSFRDFFKKLGDKIQDIIDKLRGKDKEEKPIPEEPETPETPETPENVNNTFLWKPESESRQNRAAVLLPSKVDATLLKVNGEEPVEYRGRTNGHRLTFFMGKTGSNYGKNIIVVASDGNSATYSITVPDGSKRFEKQF